MKGYYWLVKDASTSLTASVTASSVHELKNVCLASQVEEFHLVMTSITVHLNLIVDTAGIRMSESRSYSSVQSSVLQQLQLLGIVVAGTCFYGTSTGTSRIGYLRSGSIGGLVTRILHKECQGSDCEDW